MKKLDSNTIKKIFNIAFYAAFFIVLIMVFKSRPSVSEAPGQNDLDQEIVNAKGIDKLSNNNFEYSYSLVVDDTNYLYSGKKKDNKESFTLAIDNVIKNYYLVDDIALVKSGNQWVLSDHPSLYFNYFDTSLIKEIVKRSKFSKENDMFEITTSSILELFDPLAGEAKDSLNTISLVYRNQTLASIEMDISNLAKHYTPDIQSAKLSLNYLKFDVVEEISIVK